MKSQEKVCFPVALTFFLHNRNHFSAAHSHSHLHSFLFLPQLRASWPHEFSPWRIDVACCVECAPSHPQPTLLAVSRPATLPAVARFWLRCWLRPPGELATAPKWLRSHVLIFRGNSFVLHFAGVRVACFRVQELCFQ